MCLKQQVRSNCRLHLLRRPVGKARLRMLAYIGVWPSVESPFLNADQIVRWQQIAETISLLHQGIKIAGLWVECERCWIACARSKRRLTRSIGVEALDGCLRLGFDSQVSR